MTANINVGGTWKNISKISVNVGGVWKNVTTAYVNVSGTWKKFFTTFVLTLTNYTGIITGGTCGQSVNRDGTVTDAGTGSGAGVDWVTPRNSTIGDSYEVRFHKTSGGVLSGAAQDVWLALSTNRVITGPSSLGNVSGTIEIGLVGTSTALISKTFSFTWSP